MTTIGDTLTPEQRAKLGAFEAPGGQTVQHEFDKDWGQGTPGPALTPVAAEDDWLSGSTACSIENGADCEACQ